MRSGPAIPILAGCAVDVVEFRAVAVAELKRSGLSHVVFARRRAVYGPALELTEHPFRAAVPTAKADAVSGLVTP